MRTKLSLVTLMTLLAVLFFFAASYSTDIAAQTPPTTYGTLDNFDVINDTGGDCHGFEIELEGISSADVAYTFGGTYQRYGDPSVVPTATGVIIRYAATYGSGAWSATTPFTLPPYLPTQGHSCWTGGVADPATYYTSGCDHFGASLNATPTRTTYRWLVENPALPGTLIPFGTTPQLPAPVWNVAPASPGAQPVAAAVIEPPAPVDPNKCGDALWAKVYVTELPDGLQANDLEHMVIDDPGVDIVPNEPIEMEWEWFLLQACPGNEVQEFGAGVEVGAGNEAVSRRFEFYKYTGQYDPDPEAIREAMCDNPLAADQQIPTRCGDPIEGVAGVGELIGTQNVAVNLAGAVGGAITAAVSDSVSTDEDTPLTMPPDTLVGNDTHSAGNVLTITSVQNATDGTVELLGGEVVFHPSLNFAGTAGFTYSISDGHGGTSNATVSVTVLPVNDRPVADAGADQSARVRDIVTLSGSAADVDSNAFTYSWSFASLPPKSKAAFSDPTSPGPTFKADKEGTYVVDLVVNDGLVDSIADTVTITVTKGKK
jgi:hypothetical protein